MTEGRSSEREAARERGLEREEFVTDEYTSGEAVNTPYVPGVGDAEVLAAEGWSELADVPGVGRDDARLLTRAGIGTTAALAEADPAEVARHAHVDEARVREWVRAAREQVGESGGR